MSLSVAFVLSSVITLGFAIWYSERRLKALREVMVQRDEALRFALLIAAHRASDRPLVDELESFVEEQETDETAVRARRRAFEMNAKDEEAREAA